MNILVTGGAGYIGSHISNLLIEQKKNVVILDNLSTGHTWALPKSAHFIRGHAGDIELVSSIIQKFSIDAVMHFAASIEVEESVKNPIKYFENNTATTIRLLKACTSNNVKQFIFSSTAAVYGNPGVCPITESSPLAPVNPYGQSKIMVENVLKQMAAPKSYPGLRYIALRYFNVAGAGHRFGIGPAHDNSTHLIKVACQAATGQRESIQIYGTDYNTLDGTCIRDYIHIDDLAQAHLLALDYLQNEKNPSLVMNCGYGHGYSVKEVLNVFQSATGIKLKVENGPRRPGDPEQLIADPSLIKKVLNWSPQHDDLAEICRSAYTWEQKLITIRKSNPTLQP